MSKIKHTSQFKRDIRTTGQSVDQAFGFNALETRDSFQVILLMINDGTAQNFTTFSSAADSYFNGTTQFIHVS